MTIRELGQEYSASVILTAKLGNNRLAYLAGRLSLSRISGDHFTRSAIAEIKQELGEMIAALELYEAAADPDATPEAQP